MASANVFSNRIIVSSEAINRKILLSEAIAIDSIFKDRNISFSIDGILKETIVDEYEYMIDKPTNKYSFNRDISFVFMDDIEKRKSMILEFNKIYSSTNPIAVMGPCIFISYLLPTSELEKLEFMFGDSLPINYYRSYIESFNKKLMEITSNRELPALPTSKPHSRKQIGYFRYWVFKERMTALYYPNDSTPRYDCEIEEYYRAEDCGINLLLDHNKIIAVDGWMNVPDELKNSSDMKLLISEKK
jgi:hypothetical protein